MRQRHIAGLAVIAVFAFSALTIAPAWGALPELVNSSGKELVKKRISVTTNGATFNGSNPLICKTASVSGEVSGLKKVVKAKMSFGGCKVQFLCTPNETGSFSTAELEGEIGYISAAEKKVGLDLWPTSRTAAEREKHQFLATVAEFQCAATFSRIRGSIIGQLAPVNKAVKTTEHFELGYRASISKQELSKLEGVEGGAKDVLQLSLSSTILPYEEVGLSMLGKARFEEEAELKA